ncbi:alcohol dehydrogenase catalytic domain-containing protein [Novosphingobium sp. G106]|uniref:alcohol dehydrogenase catalytic domain-containing protein n=1 Tax=Novosphingobium sp. G106 TaxID=2849500 RepID=UPI001C2D3F4F|nr:alcohol dehydrogenase catalytic domain-containing protein [Novosphingobium sp. G106]MBV1688894.1 alcohol dehydrogenase catalytic domain-containing protein [Novosphingobium sp. G106]
MRAAIFLEPGEPLQIAEVPDPSPGEGEIVLRVNRCGICGSDVHMTAKDGYGFPRGSVLGHEFCGEVVALGKAVESVRLGDRVTALPFFGCGTCDSCRGGEPGWCSVTGRAAGFGSAPGGYAQFVAVAARSSVILPGGISDDLGALVEPMAVALHGTRRAVINSETRVAVLGAGPIGLGAAFWARRLGAGRIAVIARSQRNSGLAMEVGADAFLTNTDEVADALGGAPHVVFECVGIPGMLDKAIKIAGPRSQVVVLGFCTHPDAIDGAACILKEVTIAYSKTYGLDDYVTVVRALEAGAEGPAAMISRVEPLAQLPGLMEAMRRGLPDCKIQIDPWA